MKKWIVVMSALGLWGAWSASAVQAQTLNGIKVEPANAKLGEAVKITVSFEPSESANCGLNIHFGDGKTEKFKIRKSKDLPLTIVRSYAQAGQYKVEAEPTTAGSSLKCLGKNQSALLTVVAPPPVAVAPPPPAAAASSVAAKPTLCPDGWALAKPGQNAKTKAFTCSAKAGSKIPEPRLNCPADLTYFENSKKGQLGCRV